MNVEIITNTIVSLTSVIALIISLVTLYLGIRDRFESSRGIISCYIEYSPIISNVYFVIKNSGNSVATIKNINVNHDLKLKHSDKMDKFQLFYKYNDFSLAPNQILYQAIEYPDVDYLEIEYTYVTLNKKYTEKYSTMNNFSESVIGLTPDSTATNTHLKYINQTLLSIYLKFL